MQRIFGCLYGDYNHFLNSRKMGHSALGPTVLHRGESSFWRVEFVKSMGKSFYFISSVAMVPSLSTQHVRDGTGHLTEETL